MESTDANLDISKGVGRAKRKGRREGHRLSFGSGDLDAGDQKNHGPGAVAYREEEQLGGMSIFPQNASEFVTALGMGLILALLQVEICSDAALAHASSGEIWAFGILGIAELASVCLMTVGCWYFSDRMESMRRNRAGIFGYVLLAVAAMAQTAVHHFNSVGLAMPVLLKIVSGAAYAVVLILWVATIWVLQRRAAVRVMFLSLATAAVFAALIAVVPTHSLRSLAVVACLLLSCFSYLSSHPSRGVNEFVSREETRQNLKFDMRTSVSLFITAAASGLCLSWAAQLGDASLPVAAASYFLAAVIVAVGIAFFGDRAVLLSAFFRWTYPVLTVVFIVIPFANAIVLEVCEVIAMAVCHACLISLLVTLVQVKLRFRVQPVYACARVLIPWTWGVLAGMALSVAGLCLAGPLGEMALTMTSMFAIALFSLSTALSPYGIDMLTMPIEPEDPDEQDDEEAHELHAWKSACEQIANEAGLTPREVDVFALLAKGRNAKVIERELFISVYTIKGHNNNIYRKLGVRSQQELIDLVESRRREIWKPTADTEQGGDHE